MRLLRGSGLYGLSGMLPKREINGFLIIRPLIETRRRDIEKFLENSQENVTGKVIIKLIPYTFQLVGIESVHDLMKSEFGQYGEMNKGWTADDAKGFTKILANQLKIYHSVNKK